MENSITGVILAGGKSKRMGSDKSWVEIDGKLMIQGAIDSIKPYCEKIVISANSAEYDVLGYKRLKDIQPDLGPLGGIHTVLENTEGSYYLITACDLPKIESKIVQNIVTAAPDYDIVTLKLPSNNFQPLPVLLSKRVLVVLEEQIKSENLRFQHFIARCVQEKTLKSYVIEIAHEPININTPEDLKKL